MRVFECPERDMEVRVNDGEELPEEAKMCVGHYRPLVERTHPVGQCRESYEQKGNDLSWHCVHEQGAEAYAPAEAK